MVHILLCFVSLPQKPLVFAVGNIGSFLLAIAFSVSVGQIDGITGFAVTGVALVAVLQVPDGLKLGRNLVVS